ncbi:MAG: hypothetical protein ACOC38_03905 [Promethearchaeia archaeon]
MQKEKVIGALIFIVAILVLIYYTWALPLLQNPWFGPSLKTWVENTFGGSILQDIFAPNPMFLIILPVWAAAVLIMVIGAWIGWTMMTTPAPEPLEDFDFDEEEIAEPEIEETEEFEEEE